LNQENDRLRDRYGKTLFGNCTMIGRRLVERGVRFVNVTWDLFWDRVQINYDAWDTHTRNFRSCEKSICPSSTRRIAPCSKTSKPAASWTKRWSS